MFKKTENEKNHLIKCWRESGLTVSQWCEQNKIPKTTFYGWMKVKKIKPQLKLSQSDFQQVENMVENVGIELCYKGVVVKLPGSFNKVIVKDCLAALRSF